MQQDKCKKIYKLTNIHLNTHSSLRNLISTFLWLTVSGSFDSSVTVASFGKSVSNLVIWNNWYGIVFLLSSWDSRFHINQIALETIIMCWKAVDFECFNAMSTVAFIKMHRKKHTNQQMKHSFTIRNTWHAHHSSPENPRSFFFLFTGNYLNRSEYSKITYNFLTFVSLSCSAIVFYSISQIGCYASVLSMCHSM